MAVKIPGPDDVQQRFATNERSVVNVQADPIGSVFENLGERGQQIAQHLRAQQIDTEITSADMGARSDLDKIRREVEQGDDASQYETQFQQRAQQVLAARGATMAPDARAEWQGRSAQLMAAGTIDARESAQRRVMDDAHAGIRRVAEEADGVINSPDATDAQRATAVQTVRDATSRAAGRRLITADQAAEFDTAAQGRYAEYQRTQGLVAATTQATDAIFSAHDSLDDRLAAARGIDNPTLRQNVENAVMQRQARDNEARSELLDEAYTNVAAGHAVPQSLVQRLSGHDQLALQDTIRERNRAIAAGQEEPRDRRMISDLNVMAISEPGRFAQQDLQAVRGRIGETAYQALAVAQARQRRGEEREGVSVGQAQTAMAMASRQLRAAGYNTSTNANDRDQAQVADFQTDLIGRLDSFAEEHDGRGPNGPEQMAIIQDLLSTHQVLRPGFMGMGATYGRGADFYVPYANMSQEDIARATAALHRSGQPVTQANIERIYQNANLSAARRTGQFEREAPAPR